MSSAGGGGGGGTGVRFVGGGDSDVAPGGPGYPGEDRRAGHPAGGAGGARRRRRPAGVRDACPWVQGTLAQQRGTLALRSSSEISHLLSYAPPPNPSPAAEE
eukprot:1109709-Prorocentrum_minimum.AAC.1